MGDIPEMRGFGANLFVSLLNRFGRNAWF